MRASYRKDGGCWRGVIRDESGKIVWEGPKVRGRSHDTDISGRLTKSALRMAQEQLEKMYPEAVYTPPIWWKRGQ